MEKNIAKVLLPEKEVKTTMEIAESLIKLHIWPDTHTLRDTIKKLEEKGVIYIKDYKTIGTKREPAYGATKPFIMSLANEKCT